MLTAIYLHVSPKMATYSNYWKADGENYGDGFGNNEETLAT